MENATKALLIAAGVLIGIMILSLGVTLFAELSSYVENAHDTIRENENREFNAKFLSCIRDDLTVHDIISIANFAHDNNVYYGYYQEFDLSGGAFSPGWIEALLETWSGSKNRNYVHVVWENPEMPGVAGFIGPYVLDGRNEDDILAHLQYTLGDTYSCKSEDVLISEETGRVYRITFRRNKK